MVNRTANSKRSKQHGFTLLELMIVMIIIGTLAAIAVPAYLRQVKSAKEAVLHADLRVLRNAVDQYTVDRQKAPQSLDDLLQAGYIKEIPVDPMTHSRDTWVTQTSEAYSSVDQTEVGTIDVHSGSAETAVDGTVYSAW